MPISDLRTRLRDGLLDFAWDEWGQMGVLSTPNRSSPWAQDPEALLVFTLEVGRRDPRLFDEVLDWLVVNEPLVSLRRLRRMSTSPDDGRLVDATLSWLAQYRPRSQARRPHGSRSAHKDLEPLYVGLGAPVSNPDEAFSAFGLLRPVREPTGKATAPDVRAPINFAFRLRLLLGVSARAEVVRFLLTADAPRFSAQVVTRSAGYAKRNVQEALTSLEQAGVLAVVRAGAEQWYTVDRARWASLLGDDLPRHRDWPQLLVGLRELLRWLDRPELEETSDYLQASQARDLLERVQADFHYAGVPVSAGGTAAEARDELDLLVERGLAALTSDEFQAA
jgi:hypothetical protein